MTGRRPTPFELAVAPWADERFPPVRTALEDLGVDPWHRDAFLFARPVVELVHALRPEGLGEGMREFAALLHACYLYWQQGQPLRRLEDADLASLLAPEAVVPSSGAAGRPAVGYVQLPSLRVWGAPDEGEAPQPLDGCFVVRRGDALAAVGVFGLHPGRDGFTVVVVEGPRPARLARAGGSPLFSPVLEGGQAAGLYSITGMEELLELGWRLAAGVEGGG